MRRISDEERRARLGERHLLAAAGSGPLDVARAMVALHSTDPSTVYLSVLARWPEATVAAVERALYDERAMVRLLAMRRTMFVVSTDLAAAVHHACAVPVARTSRKTYVKYLAEAGVGDDDWLTEVCAAAAAELERHDEVTAAQLSARVPLLRSKIGVADGKAYAREQSITPWVMILLAAEGRIARGRPLGSWTSSQWRWSALEKWLPGGLPALDPAAARAELARAWLRAFGPATAADLKWWTGWTLTAARAALADVGAVEVGLAEGTGHLLPDDLEPVVAEQHWVALLPALDPTPMGWQQREWYLGAHKAAVFDRTGNVGPTVWCDGRIVGGWAQRPDGDIAVRLVEDVGSDARREIDTAAANLGSWLGEVRLSARGRGRTPLESELSS